MSGLTISGGFLDGQDFQWPENLTCLIGARGTGKTTVLELLRFALDALPDGDSDPQGRRRVESLVERNLQGGTVEVTVETGAGVRYLISRTTGEAPVVLTADRKPTDITLRSGGIFAADIYSQNEVEAIADRPLAQLDLIDRFDRDDIAAASRWLMDVGSKLDSNAAAVLPLKERIAALAEELGTRRGIEDRLAALTAQSGGGGAEINRAHAHRSLRDRERRAVSGAEQLLAKLHGQLGGIGDQFAAGAEALFGPDVLSGPNASVMAEIREAVLACGRNVERLLHGAAECVSQAREALAEPAGTLDANHAEQEAAFQTMLKKHQAAQGQAAERTRLERVRNDLMAKEQQHRQAQVELKKLSAERQKLLDRLSELRDERFALRQAVAERINEELGPAIRVTVHQAGNVDAYRALLEDALRNARVRQSQVADRLSQTLTPADLVDVVRRKDAESLMRSGINAEQAQKAITALAEEEVLLELEAVELADLPRIELKDGELYKDSSALSTGQKCTVILPILLLDNDNPLLVDQPEDNLDNRFICDTIIKTIRRIKARRQLIFVTHNPNIPVLGDAERVFVLESDGARGWVKARGNVDECKGEIVTLLEGGEDAFRRRQQRYAY